jgi:hypothetical protein
MGLAEVIESFLSQTSCTAETRECITLLKSYMSDVERNNPFNSPQDLRYFLGNWYLARCVGVTFGEKAPAPAAMLDAVAAFIEFATLRRDLKGENAAPLLAVVSEFSITLPSAIDMSGRLIDYVSDKRGPFAFPEFLTTFEEGGRSEYDVDTTGRPASLEGYFTILRIDGVNMEAEENITEKIVWPIVIPEPLAGCFKPGFMVNLELVRRSEGWVISGCGLVHPPGVPVP